MNLEVEVIGISDKQFNAIVDVLMKYGEARKNDTDKGQETPILSALLVEKYAWGIHEALTAIDLENGSRNIIEIADNLCLAIDPEFHKNRSRRYRANSSDILFGKRIENDSLNKKYTMVIETD